MAGSGDVDDPIGAPPPMDEWASLSSELEGPEPRGATLLPVIAAAVMTSSERRHASVGSPAPSLLSAVLSAAASSAPAGESDVDDDDDDDDEETEPEDGDRAEGEPHVSASAAAAAKEAAEGELESANPAAVASSVRELWRGSPYALVRVGGRCLRVWKALLPLGWEDRMRASLMRLRVSGEAGRPAHNDDDDDAAPSLTAEWTAPSAPGGMPRVVMPGPRRDAADEDDGAGSDGSAGAAAAAASRAPLLMAPPRLPMDALLGWSDRAEEDGAALTGPRTLWLVLLFRSGRFAGAVFDPSPLRAGTEEMEALPRRRRARADAADEALGLLTVPRQSLPLLAKRRCLVHTTHTAYTVRRKQGGAQSSKDSGGGGRPRSMGANLRREGELKLRRNIAATVAGWEPLVRRCCRVYIGCASSTESELMTADTADADSSVAAAALAAGRASAISAGLPAPSKRYGLRRADPRVRRLPFAVGKPSFTEACTAFTKLAACEDAGSWQGHLRVVVEALQAPAPPAADTEDMPAAASAGRPDDGPASEGGDDGDLPADASALPGITRAPSAASSTGPNAVRSGVGFALLGTPVGGESDSDGSDGPGPGDGVAGKSDPEADAARAERDRERRRAKKARQRANAKARKDELTSAKAAAESTAAGPAARGAAGAIPPAVMARARTAVMLLRAESDAAAASLASATGAPFGALLAAIEGRGGDAMLDCGPGATRSRLAVAREAQAAGCSAAQLFELLGWDAAVAVAVAAADDAAAWRMLPTVPREEAQESAVVAAAADILAAAAPPPEREVAAAPGIALPEAGAPPASVPAGGSGDGPEPDAGASREPEAEAIGEPAPAAGGTQLAAHAPPAQSSRAGAFATAAATAGTEDLADSMRLTRSSSGGAREDTSDGQCATM